ncbi:MAG: 50S ribosomal protein L17, partial [Deltaproteobacteria bacterium]|nr:50S ribosomal protein L17 [Deltaproteobacteria bacterium]
MRHLKSGRALGVSTSHRRAMMRNMVTSLVETEMIRTTVTRAK